MVFRWVAERARTGGIKQLRWEPPQTDCHHLEQSQLESCDCLWRQQTEMMRELLPMLLDMLQHAPLNIDMQWTGSALCLLC